MFRRIGRIPPPVAVGALAGGVIGEIIPLLILLLAWDRAEVSPQLIFYLYPVSVALDGFLGALIGMAVTISREKRVS